MLYYAALMGIDSSYYEAAEIDGAGRWQRIRFITLPAIRPTVSIMILMAVGKIFYSDFGLFYQIQIRPHFYLNCLKTLYGMAAAGSYGQLREMILTMSEYLRLVMKDHDVSTPLSKESDDEV